MASMLSQIPFTPQLQEAQLNHLLQVADYRYRLYLDLLLSVQHTPKETWPVPQWYNLNSVE
jgi:hypothetical protein